MLIIPIAVLTILTPIDNSFLINIMSNNVGKEAMANLLTILLFVNSNPFFSPIPESKNMNLMIFDTEGSLLHTSNEKQSEENK